MRSSARWRMQRSLAVPMPTLTPSPSANRCPGATAKKTLKSLWRTICRNRFALSITEMMEVPRPVLLAISRYVHQQERRPIILDKPPWTTERDNRVMLLNRLSRLAAIGTLAVGFVFLLTDFPWLAAWAAVTGALGLVVSHLNRVEA